MIIGSVTARREARLLLTIRASIDRVQHVDAVLNTGFNGSLTLPGDVIRALRLRSIGARTVTLGDGSTVVLRVYRARVVWHTVERAVLILEAEGAPLLGMTLRYGSRVVLDVVVDGTVTVEPLP
jgi:clan AA aspartic protease